MDVDFSWDEAVHMHATGPSDRRRYQVPLSKGLQSEDDVDLSVMTLRERKEDSFKQKGSLAR